MDLIKPVCKVDKTHNHILINISFAEMGFIDEFYLGVSDYTEEFQDPKVITDIIYETVFNDGMDIFKDSFLIKERALKELERHYYLEQIVALWTDISLDWGATWLEPKGKNITKIITEFAKRKNNNSQHYYKQWGQRYD